MEIDSKRIFGQNVRKLRKAAGLSQEEMAFLIGCHRNYLGSIERGERNVSLLNIVAIAQALKCDISNLFEEININKK